MARRFRGSLPLLMAGLLLQTGCVTMPQWDAAPADPAAKSGTTLPQKESAELHLNLADKFEKNRNLGEAAAQLEMARKENPGLKDVDHRLAILYDEIGKLQTALKEYEKKLAANPKDPVLLNDIGWCYYDLGSWGQAEKSFRQAVAVNPDYKLAWNNLGLTLGQQERYTESKDAFLKVVSPAEAECNLAFIFLTQGKRSDAWSAYQRAVQLDPSSLMARTMLAKLEEERR
jgi:Tfp pilus assembly protein PilF